MTQTGPSRILVDSSLWIEYYKPSGRPRRREAVREALMRDIVGTTAIIVVEVLQGAATSEEYQDLREDFAGYHWLDVTRDTAERAARVGFDLHRRGQAVPPTDLIIAAVALEHAYRLWHLDEHFARIAKVAPLKQRCL